MSFRRYLTFLILVFICLTANDPALTSQIDTQMAHIVQKLAMATRQRDIPAEQINLAVFPFQAEEKLIKKKVDFAMGEIPTHHLVKEGSFRLVERQAHAVVYDRSIDICLLLNPNSSRERDIDHQKNLLFHEETTIF